MRTILTERQRAQQPTSCGAGVLPACVSSCYHVRAYTCAIMSCLTMCSHACFFNLRLHERAPCLTQVLSGLVGRRTIRTLGRGLVLLRPQLCDPRVHVRLAHAPVLIYSWHSGRHALHLPYCHPRCCVLHTHVLIHAGPMYAAAGTDTISVQPSACDQRQSSRLSRCPR